MSEETKIEKELNPQQRQAAYALNLCLVSISQIIDYNDLIILDQEYDGILNNLNIENMPKDDALLKILKQILDTITFFRIEEGEKQFIELDYQRKMKNAIWSAVPNLGLLVTGGNPATIAVSLASQVGIGYMNYRKRKAEISYEKERQEWELQRSAIEQFNGLRRELFDTAWRLTEAYGIHEEYRLTERQISQYNEILMDPNYLRRYKRLEYIKNNFKAYPPFWYYFGNAAKNILSQDKSLSEDEKANYEEKAQEHFEKCLEITENNLLREDPIEATCALELFDIYRLPNKNKCKDELKKLLGRAKKAAGTSNDILELCAIAYLQINEVEEASKILEMLVNEGYNAEINAQLLSEIYVQRYLKGEEACKTEYETLIKMTDGVVNSNYLFPMPSSNEKNTELEIEFTCILAERFKNMYIDVLSRILEKYRDLCENIVNNPNKEENISLNLCNLLDNFYDAICQLPYINNAKRKKLFNLIRDEIIKFNYKDSKKIIDNITQKVFEFLDQNIEKSWSELVENIKKIQNIQDDENKKKANYVKETISKNESILIDLCRKEEIPKPIIEIGGSESKGLSNMTVRRFEYWSDTTPKAITMLNCINDNKHLLRAGKTNNKTIMCVKDSKAFDSYFSNIQKLQIATVGIATIIPAFFAPIQIGRFIITAAGGFMASIKDATSNKNQKQSKNDSDKKSIIVAVLKNNIVGGGKDIIFTTDGLYLINTSDVFIPKFEDKTIIPYSKVKCNKEKTALTIENTSYKNKNVNIEALYNLIQELKKVQ